MFFYVTKGPNKALLLKSARAASAAPTKNEKSADALWDKRAARRPHSIAHFLSGAVTLLAIASVMVIPALGQSGPTTINLGTQGRNVDFASFPFTRPVAVGSSLPATCEVGQLFFNSSAPAGSNLFACTATDTWTAVGTGSVNQPQISLSSSAVTFGSQNLGTTSGLETVTLTNQGNALLTVNSMQMTGANAADFASANTCGTTVASGASCTISITFTPSAGGAETANLVINDSQVGSPQTIGITGTGVAPQTNGGLVITPSAARAQIDGSITFTSNRPVNWALTAGSAGNLTVNSPTSATYTAPASIPTQNMLAGCPVMPDDAVFNVRIDGLLVHAQSAAWASTAAPGVSLSFDTSWGTSIGDNTGPLTAENFNYTPSYNGLWLIPPVPRLKRENGDLVSSQNGQDHHVLAVNRNTCQFYELYNDYHTPRSCTNTGGNCTAQSGWTYNSTSYALPVNGSTDAAGLPLGPLTLHLDEVKAGAVRHALRFTLARGYIQAGNPLWPANGTNGWGGSNTPPYGARFRLKASYDISQFSPTAQVILRALQQYGMIVADIGTGPTISTDTDLTEDPTVMAALSQIESARISMSSFEAVDESPLMVSQTSAQVNPANGYVTPASYAVVTATDQSNSNYTAAYPVPLQGVTIGLSSPTMWIMAGMSGYQLSWWVNGTGDQNVTWSLFSGAGAVSTAGIYTPPSSVASPAGAVLQAVSEADPNTKAYLYVTVIPEGTNPTGSIRIDSGGLGQTDNNGNVWMADQAVEAGDYVLLHGDYPGWPEANNPELTVYESAGHTYGGDVVYNLIVPNGNYKVRLMFGQPYNGSSPSTCTPFPSSWHAPLDLETQGHIQIHDFDFGLPINYACATPVDEYIPAQVTNNTLEIALRPDVLESAGLLTPDPQLNGLEITPDSTAPYLTIDTRQQTTVAAGNTLQLYAVGWYMNNTVTWSMSGPGSISSTGLYTAPAAAPASPQTVTIVATSTVNSGISATATLTIPIGSNIKH